MKVCYNCNSEINDEYKFCPNCGKSQSEINCPSCSQTNNPGSNFCQGCGKNLGEKNKTEKEKKKPEVELIPEPIPETGITIEFNYSTSQSFDFALAEARKFESFVQFGEGKKSTYRVNIPNDQVDQLDDLIEHMKGWRNRRVYENGEKIPWDSVFSFKWCFDQRKASYKPDFYCFGYENNYNFNLWGCIQTRLSFTENSELFTYGKWANDKGDWQFDKERIKHELEKTIFQYRFCPAMNLDLIEDVIEAFPITVNPSKDKKWTFVQNWGSNEGLKVIVNDYGYKEEVYMNGAIPKNMKDFTSEISKKIKRKLPTGFK